MPFRFIAGSDDYLVLRKAQQEWSALCEAVGDADAAEIIDGHAGNVDEVGHAVSRFIAAVQTVSMFSPQKAVWLRGISFLADSVTGRAAGTESEIERLQHCLADYDSANVHILLSASPVDRRKRPYKWLLSKGDSVFIEGAKDSHAMVALIAEEAAALGVVFAGNAARVLADKVGPNSRLALEETRKLATYAGKPGAKISSAMVAELVPNSSDSDFFEVTEAFYMLDIDWTMAAIQRHFFAGHDARPIITSMQNRNRLMIQLKALISSGTLRGSINEDSLARAAAGFRDCFDSQAEKSSFHVFSQNPWYMKKIAAPLDRLTLRQLIQFHEALRDAFMGIIDRPNEQEAVIRAMAIRCLSPVSR